MKNKKPIEVAYFSMEFAFDIRIPNYAGGLGVLAADIMYSLAEKEFPSVGVSLIYHQSDDPKTAFHPEKFMKRLPETIEVEIEGRQVKVGVFQYDVVGKSSGNTIPIYFLTTNFPENQQSDKDLTKSLYSSGQFTRLGQEAILGIGGFRMLRKLGYTDVKNFHMNEGHSAFLTLECLKEKEFKDDEVRKICTFTTHTPVPAGHDYFDYDLAHRMLGDMIPWHIKDLATQDRLSMTHLAMNLSKETNSVSEKHREVCRDMFPGYEFDNITNGIYHRRWVSAPMEKLFDLSFPEWETKPEVLRDAPKVLSDKKLVAAHHKNKKALIEWINENDDFYPYHSKKCLEDYFDEETLTLAFARRFVPYKRPALIFEDLDRLRNLGYRKIQIIFAGKCHPDDDFCNWKRYDLRHYGEKLRGQIRIAVLPQYNLEITKKLIAGADMWLNTPVAPQEASGTSGMKAALNGLLNLSILDGWWIEGLRQQPDSGWGFGAVRSDISAQERDRLDAEELYTCLEEAIDCYYHRQDDWVKKMKSAISLGGYFNTHRCIDDYHERMWK